MITTMATTSDTPAPTTSAARTARSGWRRSRRSESRRTTRIDQRQRLGLGVGDRAPGAAGGSDGWPQEIGAAGAGAGRGSSTLMWPSASWCTRSLGRRHRGRG